MVATGVSHWSMDLDEYAGEVAPKEPEKASILLEELDYPLEAAQLDAEKDYGLKPIVECVVPTIPITYEAASAYEFMDDDTCQRLTLNLIRKLLSTGPFSLIDVPSFNGSGIYAIFYHGELPIYTPLRSVGSTCPIYIGKAENLSARTRDHIKTIKCTTLGIENFTFRFVRLDDYVEQAEHKLIDLFNPVWNKFLKGFGERAGDHQTSRKTGQQVSKWDAYHPGRKTNADVPRDLAEIEEGLKVWLRISRNSYDNTMELLGLPRP